MKLLIIVKVKLKLYLIILFIKIIFIFVFYISIDDIINHWNINRIYIFDFKNILKLIFVLIICLLPGILFVVIKNDSNIIMVFALKIGVPMFIIPFLIYSIGFYYLIKISCGPMENLLKKLQEI